jgi:hypothetical protein
MFKDLFRALASVAVLGIATSVSGCDGNITIDGMKGVPLAELDLSGAAPKEVALLGPDKVHVISGDNLAISVDGDDATKAKLRFTLHDGKPGSAQPRCEGGARPLQGASMRKAARPLRRDRQFATVLRFR